MAFDPKGEKYRRKTTKKLPVLLLLDVSGSMQGKKIEDLHDAVVEMINSYVEIMGADKKGSREIEVAIITFGAQVQLYTSYTPVADLQKKGIPQFTANGGTPLGTALEMAKDMLEDPTYTPKGNYIPAVVLVSDGEPNDDGWPGSLDRFINEGRTRKCQRFAVAIGADADEEMLQKFAQGKDAMFYANNAKSLVDAFRAISTQSTNVSNPIPAPPPPSPAAGGPTGEDIPAAPGDDDPWI